MYPLTRPSNEIIEGVTVTKGSVEFEAEEVEVLMVN